MHHAEHFDTIVRFVRGIGLPLHIGPLAEPGFLPGITLHDGALVVDPDTLQWPGDILHEAGHLAVLPAARRAGAGGVLGAEHDAPGSGEQEALAWAFAAGQHLQLPPTVVFHAGGYKGQAEGLILSYSLGVCPGLRGLCEAGMTGAPGFASAPGTPVYPQMAAWLRP